MGILSIIMKRDYDEKAMFSVESCQFTSGPYHLSNTPLFRPLGRMQTPPPAGPATPAGLLRTTQRTEQWSVWEIILTRSELTAVYWKRLSRMLPEFVVVTSKDSRINTSWNWYSANESVYSPPSILGQVQLSNYGLIGLKSCWGLIRLFAYSFSYPIMTLHVNVLSEGQKVGG